MIRIKARPAEAEDARNSRARPAEAIAKFSNADNDNFRLKLVVQVLIRGSLMKQKLAMVASAKAANMSE